MGGAARTPSGGFLGARSRAAAAAFGAPPKAAGPLFGIGHNQGPPLTGGWARHCWRVASAAAWKTPRPEVLRRRIAMAAAVGLTYREYALELMERGRWLTPGRDDARVAEIIAARRIRS